MAPLSTPPDVSARPLLPQFLRLWPTLRPITVAGPPSSARPGSCASGPPTHPITVAGRPLLPWRLRLRPAIASDHGCRPAPALALAPPARQRIRSRLLARPPALPWRLRLRPAIASDHGCWPAPASALALAPPARQCIRSRLPVLASAPAGLPAPACSPLPATRLASPRFPRLAACLASLCPAPFPLGLCPCLACPGLQPSARPSLLRLASLAARRVPHVLAPYPIPYAPVSLAPACGPQPAPCFGSLLLLALRCAQSGCSVCTQAGVLCQHSCTIET